MLNSTECHSHHQIHFSPSRPWVYLRERENNCRKRAKKSLARRNKDSDNFHLQRATLKKRLLWHYYRVDRNLGSHLGQTFQYRKSFVIAFLIKLAFPPSLWKVSDILNKSSRDHLRRRWGVHYFWISVKLKFKLFAPFTSII